MKRFYLFSFLAVLLSCSQEPPKDFTPKPPEQIKTDIERFINNRNWEKSKTARHPVIAVSAEELKRLKNVWHSEGPEHKVLAERFERADKALTDTLYFPPEGGQHNQWYQCSDCQTSLVTFDEHHHKCPKCEKVYSGFPYDNVLYGRRHSRNFSSAEDAAWAWKITGDRKYADFTAKVLTGYAERYLKYPMVHAAVNDKTIDVAAEKNGKYNTAGHIMEQTLNESMLMISAVTAYDLIYDSGLLSEEDKQLIEEKLIRAMADCINVYKSGKSNWQTWHNTALFYAGMVLGDKQMVSQAFLDSENGFMTQMKISVLPEGMWYENSWGYHYYTLGALTIMASGAKRLGIDIYSHEMLHKMYLIAFDYLMSDGSLPRFGDAVNDSPDNPGVNEEAYSWYGDERLLSTLGDKPTWDAIICGRDLSKKAEKPFPVSKLIPGSGHAILSTKGEGKLTAAITFGPYGGFHGHFDKLSFVFFGYGNELGIDPGRAASQAYRLPVHSAWYKATTGHNAVLVDGMGQKAATGNLISFKSSDYYVVAAADAGPAFENVTHKRFLLLGPDYLCVIDRLASADGKEHTFDWLYHNTGSNAETGWKSIKEIPGKVPDGYAYLQDIKSLKSENKKVIQISFFNDSLSNNLTMISSPGDLYFTATGPFSGVTDRACVFIARRKGINVNFVTILQPVSNMKRESFLQLEKTAGKENEYRILRTESEDIISFDGNDFEKFRIMNKTASGETMVLSGSDK
jgi:rubrerythrin